MMDWMTGVLGVFSQKPRMYKLRCFSAPLS
jgi:hypothetical protein